MVFLLRQVELLWPKDGTWTCYTDPANEWLCIYLEVLHGIEPNEGACAAKACFAVDCNRSRSWLGEMLFTWVHKLVYNGLRRCWSVSEDHIFVINILLQETCPIILGLVQADDFCHVQVLEDVNIASGCVSIAMHRVSLVYWSHKGQKFTWDDPV